MQVAREWSLGPYAPAPRTPYREPDRSRRPAELRRRRSRPPLAVLGLAFLCWSFLVGLGVVYVNREANIVRQGRELQELRNAVEKLEEENRALEAQVASLSSVQRIAQEARRLGLVPPSELKVAAVDRAAVMAAMAQPEDREPEPVQMAAASRPAGLWDRVRGYLARWWMHPAQEQASGR
ncbi:MAG: septum formation initiator family protein [Firmicutes bacterium]|nr:septum formation initiator family protein [Bacillota bacterium]